MGISKPGNSQLPHLETFSKAAELGSFTDAAKALHVTQAAVSQRVAALEKTLARALFQRPGGRVLLTDAGQKLYEYAQQILGLHQEARQVVTGRKSPLVGELLLAASSIPGEHVLPALLSSFRTQYAGIKIRATVSDSMAVMAQIERGEANLGLVGRKAESPHLEFSFLARDRMVLVVPPGHALSKARKLSVRRLAKHPLILREAGSGLRHCFEKSLERAGVAKNDLQVALELGSNEAIKEAILQGVGVSILSVYAVQKELHAGRLHALQISDLECDRDLFIVRDRRRVLPPSARTFLAFVAAHPMLARPS